MNYPTILAPQNETPSEAAAKNQPQKKFRWKADARQKRNGMTKSEWIVWKNIGRVKSCEIQKNGWPDFLVAHEDNLYCLEVKTGTEPITADQKRMHALLARKGIATYIIRDGWCEELGKRFL